MLQLLQKTKARRCALPVRGIWRDAVYAAVSSGIWSDLEEIMKHATLDEIKPLAEVIPFPATSSKMSRRERLERWATVLERYQGSLRPLLRIEYLPEWEYALARGTDSPLTVAYQDSILREEGLTSDHLSDAMSFFDLTKRQAHYLLCDCHYYYGSMTAADVAAGVRSTANRVTFGEFWRRIRFNVIARR
jgi:hypothetical protein